VNIVVTIAVVTSANMEVVVVVVVVVVATTEEEEVEAVKEEKKEHHQDANQFLDLATFARSARNQATGWKIVHLIYQTKILYQTCLLILKLLKKEMLWKVYVPALLIIHVTSATFLVTGERIVHLLPEKIILGVDIMSDLVNILKKRLYQEKVTYASYATNQDTGYLIAHFSCNYHLEVGIAIMIIVVVHVMIHHMIHNVMLMSHVKHHVTNVMIVMLVVLEVHLQVVINVKDLQVVHHPNNLPKTVWKR
jgi:hypothetical protein